MANESPTCPKCGNSDWQEVKQGTYFCNRCDHVFGDFSPAGASAGPATCYADGVLAVGYCATCHRPFCGSHKERADVCLACGYHPWQDSRDQELRFGRSFFTEGSARRTLLDAGVPTVEFHRVHRQRTTKYRGLFGARPEVVTEVVESLGRGWLLGRCKWEYNTVPRHREGFDHRDSWLILLWDDGARVPKLPRLGDEFAQTVVPVREDTVHGGYECPETYDARILVNWGSLSRVVYDLAASPA